MAGAGSVGAVAQTNSAAAANAATNVTHIASDHGDFDMTEGRRRAVYSGHVRVDDPQMRLTCERLVADLPSSGGRMNHIVARTNVVIDFTDDRGQTNHATSDKAVYSLEVKNGVTNGLVTLTGNARVDNAQMTMTGEPIYVDVENKQMHADDQKMIFKGSFETGMTKTNSPAAGTNNPASPKVNLPPGSIENIDKMNSRTPMGGGSQTGGGH
jgi:lipopolysaccharide transport protein LptA